MFKSHNNAENSHLKNYLASSVPLRQDAHWFSQLRGALGTTSIIRRAIVKNKSFPLQKWEISPSFLHNKYRGMWKTLCLPFFQCNNEKKYEEENFIHSRIYVQCEWYDNYQLAEKI